MGRPKKPEHEKLLPVSTNVTPECYAELCRQAKLHRRPLAQLLRDLLAGRLPQLIYSKTLH